MEIQLLEGADVLGRAPDATPEDGEWEPLKEELREDLEDADVLEDPLHTDLEDASTQEESRWECEGYGECQKDGCWTITVSEEDIVLDKINDINDAFVVVLESDIDEKGENKNDSWKVIGFT